MNALPARQFRIAASILLLLGINVCAQISNDGLDYLRSVPPRADADPSIRHKEVVKIPTKLIIGPPDKHTVDLLKSWGHSADYTGVGLDANSIEPTEITVGQRMIVGARTQLFVYPEGEPRPAKSVTGLGGVDALATAFGTSSYQHKRDGIATAGKPYSYVFEMIIEVFETNKPGSHFWSPFGDKYKVLLTRTVKQIALLDCQLELPDDQAQAQGKHQ